MNAAVKRSKVALVRCEDYNEDKVYRAVEKGIDLLGGVAVFTKAGEKILLKPNILIGDKPGKGTTTHPLVFQAVGRLFKEGGAILSYGDSPAIGKPERAAKAAGFQDIAEMLGIRLADFREGQTVSFPGALLAKQLYLANGALEADGIISISKMKSHGFAGITGAVKNQFGCIPGLRKTEYHVKMPNIYDFSRVLTDINRFLKPRLYIMDGITAMEGNSTRWGDLVNMKVLLFSTDPVALDAVCCRLMNLDPEFVPTSIIGREGGLGTYRAEEIEITGDDIETSIYKNFRVERRSPDTLASSRSYPNFLKNYISPRPVISRDRCVKCGQCILQCPVNPKAVDWPKGDKNRPPVYDYKRCIRCYCCQEVCKEKAISIKVPLLGKLIYR